MKFDLNYVQNGSFQFFNKDKVIKEVINTKFLGLKTDKNMYWKNHTVHILTKLSIAFCTIRYMYNFSNIVFTHGIIFVAIYWSVTVIKFHTFALLVIAQQCMAQADSMSWHVTGQWCCGRKLVLPAWLLYSCIMWLSNLLEASDVGASLIYTTSERVTSWIQFSHGVVASKTRQCVAHSNRTKGSRIIIA
jgi:hypothetical protein